MGLHGVPVLVRSTPRSSSLRIGGRAGAHADESGAEIGLSQSCGSGVIVRLDYPGSEEPVPLWIERSSKVTAFPRLNVPAVLGMRDLAAVRFQAVAAGGGQRQGSSSRV